MAIALRSLTYDVVHGRFGAGRGDWLTERVALTVVDEEASATLEVYDQTAQRIALFCPSCLTWQGLGSLQAAFPLAVLKQPRRPFGPAQQFRPLLLVHTVQPFEGLLQMLEAHADVEPVEHSFLCRRQATGPADVFAATASSAASGSSITPPCSPSPPTQA